MLLAMSRMRSQQDRADMLELARQAGLYTPLPPAPVAAAGGRDSPAGIAVSKHRLQELIQLRAAAVAAGDVTAGARHRCRGSAGGWWSLAGPRLECWMVE